MTIRKITSVSQGDRLAHVYRDVEWDEFRVKFYIDGVYQKDADMHTDDREDAVDTAKHWVAQSPL